MPLFTDAADAADNRGPSHHGKHGHTKTSRWRAWLRDWVSHLSQSSILKNTTWMLSGRGLELVVRFAYFAIVAHTLGPTGYGTFVACIALVAAMSPFASWGTSDVMIKHVARNRTLLPAYLGNAFLVTAASGSLLTLLALLLRSRVLPPSATSAMLTAVAIAELLGAQTITVCLHAFVALEQFRRYTQLLALQTGMRFVAALVLTIFPASPLLWALLYAASSLLTAICGLIVVVRHGATPRLQLDLVVPSVREGFHFSTSTASRSIYNDIDKTMLARLSSVEAAAIYAVAYRLIEVAMLPIQCVAAATYPEFFRQGIHGVTSTFRFARRIIRSSVLYGIATSIALYLAAGMVPLVFGRAYTESAIALRWLCPLPAIKSVHSFLTDTLTGANYQWQRSASDIAVAVVNVLINLWIIRAYAWRGAAWSSLITDASLAALLYIIIRWHLRREGTTAGPAIGQPVSAANVDQRMATTSPLPSESTH